MKQHNSTTFPPWYRQFWPWFLIALPATAVVGGLFTVWIAFQQDTGLVKDNYYREGLNINAELEKQSIANAANITARLQFLDEDSKILLLLQGDTSLPEQLQLLLTAPANPDKDRIFSLQTKTPGLYQTKLSEILHGNYYLQLSPSDNRWIIKGQAHLSGNKVILLPATQ